MGLDKIKQLAVPLCSIEEQDAILGEMEQKLSVISAAGVEIDHALQRAARLRHSIVKQAFEGKLVPQEPSDEPASVLLERLCASRISNTDICETKNTSQGRGRRRPKRTIK